MWRSVQREPSAATAAGDVHAGAAAEGAARRRRSARAESRCRTPAEQRSVTMPRRSSRALPTPPTRQRRRRQLVGAMDGWRARAARRAVRRLPRRRLEQRCSARSTRAAASPPRRPQRGCGVVDGVVVLASQHEGHRLVKASAHEGAASRARARAAEAAARADGAAARALVGVAARWRARHPASPAAPAILRARLLRQPPPTLREAGRPAELRAGSARRGVAPSRAAQAPSRANAAAARDGGGG